MLKPLHRYYVALCAFLLLLTLFNAPPTHAQPQGERCFAETGYCISGRIRAYWEQNGGLSVFGYPISPLRDELIEGTWRGPTQWFERDRLEDHSADGHGVLAGRLGARYLEIRGTPWVRGTAPADKSCRYFAETGYNLCGRFRTYWEQNGGLARFGYPITGEVGEQVEGTVYNVQYFERRRMEYHPEQTDPKYQVLLGLLGREVSWYSGASLCTTPVPEEIRLTAFQYYDFMGCPSAGLRTNIPMSVQPFANGMMLWVQNEDSSGGKIFVVMRSQETGVSYWSVFDDTYIEGEPVNTDIMPPPGYYVPTRGFGKLWRDNPWVKEMLGFATLPERADNGYVQPFSDGNGLMIYRYVQNMVLLLSPNSISSNQALEMVPVR